MSWLAFRGSNTLRSSTIASRTLRFASACLRVCSSARSIPRCPGIGLDSLRNGSENQSRFLDWQVRTAFAEGCAGAFVFSWTDEWYRGGHDILDWAFGLTDWERRPKPALEAVQRAFTEVPFPPEKN